MSDKPLNKTAIAEAVEKAPPVADVLRKLAGKVVQVSLMFYDFY